MPYEIRYSNEAVEQLKKLRVFDRTAILDQIEQVLGVNPTIVSNRESSNFASLHRLSTAFGLASSASSTTWRKKPSSSFRC